MFIDFQTHNFQTYFNLYIKYNTFEHFLQNSKLYRHRPQNRERKIEKDKGRRLGGLAFGSAPSAPGYLKGALRLTFHMAMKSWKKEAARSAEKN